jgi:hypothetical protein
MDYLSDFEKENLELDHSGAFLNLTEPRRLMLIGSFIFIKLLINRIFLHPRENNMTKIYIHSIVVENLRAIATLLI